MMIGHVTITQYPELVLPPLISHILRAHMHVLRPPHHYARTRNRIHSYDTARAYDDSGTRDHRERPAMRQRSYSGTQALGNEAIPKPGMATFFSVISMK